MCRVRMCWPQLRPLRDEFLSAQQPASLSTLFTQTLFFWTRKIRAGLSFDALVIAPRGNSSSRRSRLARTADGRPAAAARVDHLHLPPPALKEFVFPFCFPLATLCSAGLMLTAWVCSERHFLSLLL